MELGQSDITQKKADLLAIAARSPDLVARHDKEGWLALFSEDAFVEDPVGAGAHAGPAQRSAFWDVFIAPNRVTFVPKRDFVHAPVVLRYATLSTVMPIDDVPFELNALIEYRVLGERIESLRAFWEPRQAVQWHAKRGLRGMAALTRHGGRTARALGVGAALGFGRALVPSVSRKAGRELAEGFAAAIGGSRARWIELVGDATIRIAPRSPDEQEATDAAAAWETTLARSPALRVEEVIVASDYVACVLAGENDVAAALTARVRRGRVSELRLLWSR